MGIETGTQKEYLRVVGMELQMEHRSVLWKATLLVTMMGA